MADTHAPASADLVAGTPLDPARVAELTARFGDERANRIARNAVTSADVLKAARNPVTMRAYSDTYGVSLKAAKTVTNQRHSGRCWLFATLNVVRARLMRTLDVDDFELSQAYGMFYDKLEKANALLGNVIETASLPWDDRTVCYLMDEGVCLDGGEWSFAANLIAKWGAVPKDVMPETACSKDSTQMNDVLSRLLRRDAVELRRMVAAGAAAEELAARRDEMIADVHRVLCSCLGEPPATFDLVCEVGKDHKVDAALVSEVLPAAEDEKSRRLRLVESGIAPQEFVRRYASFDPTDYVELTSIPGGGREFGHAYGVRFADTVAGGARMRFLNVAPEVLEDAAVASLKAGVPCYMACDVSQEFGRHLDDFPGILACDTMDRESLFRISLDMTREEMYDSREGALTHAMTFQGVSLGVDGRPSAWRVENSWGKDACKDGYLLVSGDWWRLYGGDVVVERRFVPADVLELWDTLPLEECEPWSGIARALCHVG